MKLGQIFSYFVYQNETASTIIVRVLIALLLGLFSSSCSEYLKGKAFRTNFIEVKSDGKLACLENVAEDMQKFLNSTGTNAQLDQTLTCINTTLTELQTRVQGGTEATAFTSAEVYELLAKFASSTKISLAAAQNLVTLKAALLGGDTGKITKAEINLLKNYLVLVTEEAKNLRPFIFLFHFKSTERAVSREQIRAGFDQLNASLKNLFRKSQLANSTYSFDSFKEAIINILNLGEDKKAMAEIASRFNILLNGNITLISDSDRMAYIDNLTEALQLYSLYTNGYAKFEFKSAQALNETLGFVESVIRLLENSLQYKKSQILSVQSVDGLVSAIAKSPFLPYKITAYNAALFYRTLLVRVFEGGAKANIAAFSGVRAIHLYNIKRELGTFKVYSRMIARLAGESSASLHELQLAMQMLSPATETEILSGYDLATQAKIINDVTDLKSEFIEEVPVIYHNKKIGIAINQRIWGQNWSDLTHGLYVKMLARLLMQGWGQIYPLENIRTNYLTELNMTNWYAEFKHFGIEIKLFDPRKFNSGPTAFKTGNLFTRSGNGDNKLNFKETVETLGVLVSGSGTIHREMSAGLYAANCNLPELDVFDNHWNFESCFQQVLRANYRQYFSSLPHLLAYLDTLSEEQFGNYFEAALNVVRIDQQNAGQRVETTDIQVMNGLLHFVEGLYLNHDTNFNRYISEAEIRMAYPKFLTIATEFAYSTSRAQIEEFTSWKGDVAGYSCFTEQDLIRESFVFLVFNGRTPTADDFNLFPCFREKSLFNFTGEVDRKSMLNTFKALKTVIGN